jgi:hypothetical protein
MEMSRPGSTGGYRKEAGEIGNGDGRTLAEHERFVNVLPVLYVRYQTQDGVELAGGERVGGGGGGVWAEEAENLRRKRGSKANWSALGLMSQWTANSTGCGVWRSAHTEGHVAGGTRGTREGGVMHLVYARRIHVLRSIAALEPPSGLAHGDGRILRPIAIAVDELVEGLDVLGVFFVRERRFVEVQYPFRRHCCLLAASAGGLGSTVGL